VPPPKKGILYPAYVGRDLQAPDTTLPINVNNINSLCEIIVDIKKNRK